MSGTIQVNSSTKIHFIEHKQAYMAAAITVLALAVIAAVTGTLALLATKGVSLGFLTSLNGLGSVGSISMLSAGGALTLPTATALGFLTTVKKGGTTPTDTSDTEESEKTSSASETKSTTLVREKFTNQDDEELTPFLHQGEYIEFQARAFEEHEGNFTRLACYTKEHQTTDYSQVILKEEEFPGELYGSYTLVTLETLRERKAQPSISDTDESEEETSITSGAENTTLVREKFTNQDDEELTPFLHRGEYIEFHERTFKDIDGNFTRQARYTKEHQPENRSSRVVLGENEFPGQLYATYTLVTLDTLRGRKTQFDKRTENVITKKELHLRSKQLKKGEYHLCADVNLAAKNSEPNIVIGILCFREADQTVRKDGEKYKTLYISTYQHINDKYHDYISVLAEGLDERTKSAEE